MSTNPEEYLASLSQEQAEAALTTDRPITILAGAGSGKTRTLIGRFIHMVTPKAQGGLGADPNSIMMVTFTNKAAREMRERLQPFLEAFRDRDPDFPMGEPWVGTFHGLSLRILRIEAKRAGLGENFTIFDESDARSLATEVADQMELSTFDVDEFFRDLEYAKARLLTPQLLAERQMEYEDALSEGGEMDRRLVTWGKLLAHFETENFPLVYGAYQHALSAQNAVDFSDLMNHVTHIFRENPEVRRSWQSTFRHFMVDEVQDINRAQIGWLDVFTNGGKEIVLPEDVVGSKFANAADGLHEVNTFRLSQFPKPTVAFVGDDDQSIYGFRGSDVTAMRGLGKRYAGLELRYLTQSYRCQPDILDVANRLVSNNLDRFDKTVVAADPAREGRAIAIEAHVTPENEIERIAVAARAHISAGGDPKQFAVLTRTRDLAKAVARGLRAGGLPVVEGKASDLRKTAEIRDVMAYLGYLTNPEAETLLRRIINKPSRGLGMTSMAKVAENAKLKNISFMQELRTVMADRVDLPEGAKPYPKAFARSAREFGELTTLMREQIAGAADAADAIFTILETSGYLPNLKIQALKSAGLPREVEFFDQRPREFLTALIRASEEEKNRKAEGLEDLDGEDLADRAGQLSETARRIGNIALLLEQAGPSETLDLFVQEATLEMDQAKPADGIQVLTMHASKGLEFDRVFLPFWIDGVFPHGRAIEGGAKDIEEERRLAYVAITRAREEVRISRSWSFRQTPFIRQRDNDRSRFLRDIADGPRGSLRFFDFKGGEKRAYTLAGAPQMPAQCLKAAPIEAAPVHEAQKAERALELANERSRQGEPSLAEIDAQDAFFGSDPGGEMPPDDLIPLAAYEEEMDRFEPEPEFPEL